MLCLLFHPILAKERLPLRDATTTECRCGDEWMQLGLSGEALYAGILVVEAVNKALR
jgi:hypothetical protein